MFLAMEKEKLISKSDLLDLVEMLNIHDKFKNPDYVPTNADWIPITEFPSESFLEPLFVIYFLNKTMGGNKPVFTNAYLEESQNNPHPETFYANFKEYARSIDHEYLEKIAYKYLPSNIKKITRFIEDMQLFSPKLLHEILEERQLFSLPQINPFLDLLGCFRPSYSEEDLIYMRKLMKRFNDLPDTRNVISKKGLLGNEKMVACCPCGNKFDPEIEYCPKCGRNPKGLNTKEVRTLKILEKEIEALDVYFGNVNVANVKVTMD